MTGLLTDLMHERADHLGAPDLDLGVITRTGERRVRRRRTALVGGIAAAAAVAVVAVPSLTRDVESDRALAADGTAAAPQTLSWVTGSTLHRVDGPDVDLGVDVRAWVWVGGDVVFTDAEHRVRIWTGDALDVIGTTAEPESDTPELVSDGTRVAWAEEGGRLVQYDAGDGSLVRAPDLPGQRVRVTAMDGDHVYVVAPSGVYDWQPGGVSVMLLDPDPNTEVMDAESGTLVRGSDHNTALVTLDGRAIEVSTREFANLSPDGRLVSIEIEDVGMVVDTADGSELPFEHGREWAVGYQWLDDSSLAVMAFDGIDGESTSAASLLTCDGRTGVCDGPTAEVPSRIGDFQLPIGIHFAR